MHVILHTLGWIYLIGLFTLLALYLNRAAKREQAKQANPTEVVGTFTHKRATTVPRLLTLGIFAFLFPKKEKVTIYKPKDK